MSLCEAEVSDGKSVLTVPACFFWPLIHMLVPKLQYAGRASMQMPPSRLASTGAGVRKETTSPFEPYQTLTDFTVFWKAGSGGLLLSEAAKTPVSIRACPSTEFIFVQVRCPDLEVRILVRQLGWFEDKEWKFRKQVDHTDGGFGGLGVKRTWYFVYQLATVYLPWYTGVISRSWLIRSEHLDYSKPRRNSAKPVLLSSASCRWRLSQLRNGREKLFCILCVRYKSKSGRPNNRVVKFQNCVVPCGLDLTLCSHMLRWAIQTFWWICLSWRETLVCRFSFGVFSTTLWESWSVVKEWCTKDVHASGVDKHQMIMFDAPCVYVCHMIEKYRWIYIYMMIYW